MQTLIQPQRVMLCQSDENNATTYAAVLLCKTPKGRFLAGIDLKAGSCAILRFPRSHHPAYDTSQLAIRAATMELMKFLSQYSQPTDAQREILATLQRNIPQQATQTALFT